MDLCVISREEDALARQPTEGLDSWLNCLSASRLLGNQAVEGGLVERHEGTGERNTDQGTNPHDESLVWLHQLQLI